MKAQLRKSPESIFSNLEFDSRQIRQEISYLFNHEAARNPSLERQFHKIQTRIQKIKLKFATELFHKASECLNFGLCCGAHWIQVPQTPKDFTEKEGNREVTYTLHKVDKDDPFDEDWYDINITMKYPSKYIFPHVDVNKINCLFNGTALIDVTNSGVAFIGKYKDHFCHLHISFKDSEKDAKPNG